PRAAPRAGWDHAALEQVPGGAALVAHQARALVVVARGQVLLPQLVGLEGVPVDVDHEVRSDATSRHGPPLPCPQTVPNASAAVIGDCSGGYRARTWEVRWAT